MAKIKTQLRKNKTEKKKSFSFSFDLVKTPVSVFLSKLKRSKNEMVGMFGRKKKALNGHFLERKKKESKSEDVSVFPAKKKEIKKKSTSFQFGLSKEKEYFVEMLSMLLNSGMDIAVALESIKQEVKNKRLKKIIGEIKENVESGLPIWKSLRESKILSPQVVSMVQIGEESGTLADNLLVISLQQKKDKMFKSKVKAALIYPVIVIVLAIVISLGISWFILPRLVPIFTSMSTEVPFLTQALAWTGQLFLNWGHIIVPAGILLTFLIVFLLFIFTPTKKSGQWLLYHIPITRKLVQEVELSRFGYTLGNLLQVGLPIEEAFDSLIKATAYYNFKRYYRYLKEEIISGETFLKSFKFSKTTKKLIPPTIQEMVGAGEQSGKLSETFVAVGEIYEQKTEITAKNLATTIEPIILIVIGLVIMAVSLSIIVPIYGLLDVFN